MTKYRTHLEDTRDGKATIGVAYVEIKDNWRLVGFTNRFRTYPRSVRARNAAAALCKRHSRRMFELHPSLSTLPQPIEIEEV